MQTKHEGWQQLEPVLLRWLALIGESATPGQLRLALAEIGQLTCDSAAQQHALLEKIWRYFNLGSTLRLAPAPDVALLPMLAKVDQHGWVIVQSRKGAGDWIVQDANGDCHHLSMEGLPCLHAIPAAQAARQERTAIALIRNTLLAHWFVFLEVAAATVILGLVGLLISFYSMQVYDRVIPSQGYQTLIVLTLGALIAILLEWFLKLARANLLEPRLRRVDLSISRALFERLQAIRLDQRPSSVGTLAGQIQGYEAVRAFFSTTTLFIIVDIPLAILFILVIGLMGGWRMAAVPLTLFPVCLLGGVYYRQKIIRYTQASAATNNRKTGTLVEVIEGADTIKGQGAAWRFLGRWNQMAEQSAEQSLTIKHMSDQATYVAMACQQIAYVLLVATGAWLVTQGEITMGGVIACSIVSGRALSPATQIPGVLVQWAYAGAALGGLEQLFRLETDNQAVERPLNPKQIEGHFALENIQFAYPELPPVVSVAGLSIRAGEKVGILGPIGSGKSTLLAILAGLLKPQQGRLLIDGLDASHINAAVLSENIAYLPQSTWLFSGTLRENLLLGQPDLGDETILAACKRSGLWSVVAQHPKGLELPLAEGGRGLSGGQRQLVGLTRLLIAKPRIWLLDEPTSGVDDSLENHLVGVLKNEIKAEQTLVVVTHRPNMLKLVERLIIITPQGIVMDGPRDAVLAKLTAESQLSPANARMVAPAGQSNAGAAHVA